MSAVVLLLGSGDVGLRMADGLLRQGGVGRLALADINAARVDRQVAMLACCHDAFVAFEAVDALDPRALETLIREVRPDLIIQAASVISPWSIIGRDHPVAKALNGAGIEAKSRDSVLVIASPPHPVPRYSFRRARLTGGVPSDAPIT